MKFQHKVLLLPLACWFISCGTQKKSPQYLEQIRDTTIKSAVKFPELTIQKNDQLSIFVYSEAIGETKEKIDKDYNLPATAGTTTGFLVDINGDIEYPGVGKIHAEGMTKIQLADFIKNKLGSQQDNALKNPSVIVRWLNYKITVLGEVNKEGPVTLPVEKVNILEAIGMAGGISVYGKKESVRVIREIDGNREIGTIDLTTNTMFSSPYYHLLQNDIILVEPSKAKARPEDIITWQKITAVVGLVSSLTFIYFTIFKSN